MVICVKYCGGCNAKLDRAGIVRSLQKSFPMHDFKYAAYHGGEIDLLLVVCGCRVGCASYDGFAPRLGKFVLTAESDYEPLCRLIRQLSDKNGCDEQ